MSDQMTPRKAEVSTPNDRQIRIERVFDAPRERVFEAWTDPELVPKWWGMGTTVVEKMDVKPGGQWRFVDGGEGQGFSGTYREVVAPEKLSYTFEWDGMPGHILVETLEFEDLGDGTTRLVNTSTFHFTEERDGMLDAMEDGMNISLEKLDELLAS